MHSRQGLLAMHIYQATDTNPGVVTFRYNARADNTL